MDRAGGLVLIGAGASVGLLTVFVLWPRLRSIVALGVLAACGASVAAGGLLVQGDAGAGDWVLAIAALAVMSPVHGRLVFGPSGARHAASGLLPPASRPRTKGGNP